MGLPSKKKKIFDNRYEILSIVGRGAASVVYHARHLSSANGDVALKVLLTQKDDRSTAELLRKEALAMVSARHKHVIRLDDFHTVGDLAYLAMEYAPQFDLRKYAAKLGGKLGPIQAQLFLIQAAEALNFTHQAGIIHRDIKPDNILVVSDREVRLGDFGVAVLPGEKSSLDDLQRGVGTMSYMAPEVLEGVRYDQSSDIYALGVTFYEMVSGKHPFESAPLLQQLEIRKDGAFPHLSTLVPALPAVLADAIMKAMSHDPGKRFATARELIQALVMPADKTPKAPPQAKAGSFKGGPEKSLPSTAREQRPAAPSKRNGDRKPEHSKTRPAESQQNARREASPQSEKSRSAERPQSQPPKDRPREENRAPRSERQLPNKPAMPPSSSKAPVPAPTQSAAPSNADEVAPTERLKEGTPAGIHTVKPKPRPQPPASPPSAPSPEATAQKVSAAASTESTAGPSPAELPLEGAPTMLIKREQVEEARRASDRALQSAPPRAPRHPAEIFEKLEKDVAIAPVRFPGSLMRAGLALAALLLCIKLGLFSGLLSSLGGEAAKKTAVNSAVDDTSISPLPDYEGAELTFPLLPPGMYAGSINNLIPGRELPLLIVSTMNAEKMIILVGMEGWSPVVINAAQIGASPDALRIKSNGFVLDFTGQNFNGELIGYFENVVSGQQGQWFVKPLGE
ncbi:MAG: protein kinase [Oligoflexia bacterium]|nr:protein kinase [Oligoflexia bacterium]